MLAEAPGERIDRQQQAEQGLGLYLHIPFCQTRCTYCDFNTYTNLSHLKGRYVLAVAQEIERTLRAVSAGVYQPLQPLPTHLTELAPEAERPRVRTVFFGGGTPSLLAGSQLERVMKAIATNGRLEPGAEVTVEANPGTLNLSKLRDFRQAGINRLSFGVQTFDDNLLKSLGRTHNGAVAVEALDMARRAGFDNVNLDFIYGLPNQSLANWQSTIERAISIQPAHLSLYGLTVEEGTAMHRQVAAGRLQPADGDSAATMYELASELLEKAGYVQYEISNWAYRSKGDVAGETPALASQHNLIYWRNQPYLGFGTGAHSAFAGWRFAVLNDPDNYLAKLRQGESVIVSELAEEITFKNRLSDTVILGLRLNEGIALAEIEQKFGKSLEELFSGVMAPLVQAGLLETFTDSQQALRLRLTLRGRLLSNEVFVRFLMD